MTDREQLELQVRASRELVRRKARNKYKTFVRVTKPDYDMRWFHGVVCDKLQLFAEGKIKKMMILMPPQHGKSQLATRQLPPFLLGRNPDLKIAIASYSDTMVQSFSRDIQRIIDSETYHSLFPETFLNGSIYAGRSGGSYARNYHEFEIVGKKGSVKTVGRGGALTGSPVDIGIIDDIYKDRAEAKSLAVSQTAWDWYNDVFLTRMHNDSQILLMNTRWDEFDLAGRLIQQESEEWEIIKFPALKTQDKVSYDPRAFDEALWPEKHSKERLEKVRAKTQVTFNSLYQQDPKPNTDILIFTDWIEIESWPMVDDGKGGKYPLPVKSWGLDFGKTTGINALIKLGQIGEDEDYFEECCYEPGLSMPAIVDILKHNGYNDGEPVQCDHMPTKISELRRLGIAAFPAIKGPGSVDAGIIKLKSKKVHYTKRSVNIKMETNNYQFVTYGNIITNIPVDEFNHAMDGCRYADFFASFV